VRTAIAIGVAGALGALARYGVKGAMARPAGEFPWATFAVNVSGSFLLGFIVTVLGDRLAVAPWLRAAVTTGFLGAYTTFSTVSLESYRLLEARSSALAVGKPGGERFRGAARALRWCPRREGALTAARSPQLGSRPWGTGAS
jgi:fluoride exporter